MAEILGLGLTHYPGLTFVDEDMAATLRRTVTAPRVPERARDPRNWPEAMRAEYGDDGGRAAAAAHRARCFDAFRVLRARLDAFEPDFVMIFGDDQYENFVEDVVPPFCLFLGDAYTSRPFDYEPTRPWPRRNWWGEPVDQAFEHRGHARGAKWLASRLATAGHFVPYAYSVRFRQGLAHAFINTLVFLDVDRRGFPHPVVPFHINCHGGVVVRSRGGVLAPSEVAAEPDPPAPSPAACFDLGAAMGRALAESPWRVAVVGSSSWSHAFLTRKNDWIYPDHASDRARLAELESGRLDAWRDLSTETIEAAGQHEMLNWFALAGAMHALGKRAEVVDYVETWVMNSNKCFAVFPA